MAALFASMAVKSALDNLSSLLPAAAASQGLEDLRTLERTMRRIHATLQDAERHWNLREESAKLRLKELKDLAYDAEELVEEYEYEVNRCRVEAPRRPAACLHGGASSSKRKRQEVLEADHCSNEASIVAVPTELSVRARKVLERFTEIEDYFGTFGLSENDGERKFVPEIRSLRQTSSVVHAPRILGREKDKENVIEALMMNSGEGSCFGSHMSVLPIVGMGGSGKTTLAQLVYNDKRVRHSFDLRAWVCVSEYFDVENITRKIITSLTQNTCHHIQTGSLQGALEDQVKEKRVFLVLDDVWNERSDYWELLCQPMLASRRCNIIVTTRSKAVTRLVQTIPFYNLNCLGPDDSWSLFKQTAFVQQEIVTASSMLEIGRSITEKCKGLPLAIKTLASILRNESDEMKWRDVLESELWDLKQSKNEVLPALELSYRYMPMHLKCCFVSLSLHRKGMYLDENRVVWLWKLLGLLESDGSDNRDEIGSLYFNELVQRSLLQNYIEEQTVMHDLVHDLACFLAGEEFFRLEGNKPIDIPPDTRYISILSGDKSIQVSNMSLSLRVIAMIETSDVENPDVLFLNCKKLRIIDIEQGRLGKALLDFMGGMKLLHHLSLSGYEDATLPSSVFQLLNLQTLDIEAHMLNGIGRLVNLNTLPDIHLSKCGCLFNIGELRNMNKIRKLFMTGLCNMTIRDAYEAHLHSKKNLEILELDFNAWKSCEHTQRSDGNQATVAVSGIELLESFRPHHQSLKVLRLRNFNFDIVYPSWLGSASFSMLTELLLHNCQSEHCPTLGELPSLNSLKIFGMKKVVQIGREFCSLNPKVEGFCSLARLTIEDMYQLQQWCGVEDGDFPRLETLTLWSDFELRSLPLVPFSSLQNLTLYDCRSLATFPPSATLRELHISTSPSLNELPALPSLWSLELFHCPSLVTFGHFPTLAILTLHEPFNLYEPFKEGVLYRLVNSHLSLERLSIWSDTLVSIDLEPQSLPSLQEIELRGRNLQYCSKLTSLTSLKKLNVCGCPRFHVPDSLRTQLEELIDLKSLE